MPDSPDCVWTSAGGELLARWRIACCLAWLSARVGEGGQRIGLGARLARKAQLSRLGAGWRNQHLNFQPGPSRTGIQFGGSSSLSRGRTFEFDTLPLEPPAEVRPECRSALPSLPSRLRMARLRRSKPSSQSERLPIHTAGLVCSSTLRPCHGRMQLRGRSMPRVQETI